MIFYYIDLSPSHHITADDRKDSNDIATDDSKDPDDIATDDSKDPDDTTISDDSTDPDGIKLSDDSTDQDYTTADDGKDPDNIATDDSSDTDHITISDHSNDPDDITTDDSKDPDDITTDDSTDPDHITISDHSNDPDDITTDDSIDPDDIATVDSKDLDGIVTNDSIDPDHITISDDSNDQDSNGMAPHQEHIAFSVKFFKCKACRKWYRSDSELQEHLKTCDNTLSSSENKSRFCGKKLARERQLKSHKKSNHRVRLKCEKCGASYSTKGNLARHDKLHHPSSGVRRFPGASMYHLLQRPSCAGTVKVHRRQSIPREWRKMTRTIRRKMQMERKLKLEIRMKVLTKYRFTYGHQGHDHGKHRRDRRENSEMICQGHLWIYKCYHCSKRYKHRRHLESHIQDHDKQQE